MLDDSLIEPITTDKLNQPAKRPLLGGLVTSKASNELDMNFSNTEEGITILKEKYGY